jgi:hypothetical protein
LDTLEEISTDLVQRHGQRFRVQISTLNSRSDFSALFLNPALADAGAEILHNSRALLSKTL